MSQSVDPDYSPPSTPQVANATASADPEVAKLPFKLGYRPELDGIRGLFLVVVMTEHIWVVWPSLGLKLLHGGFQAVDVFFVLSGFLLTSLMLEEHHKYGKVAFKSFYQRRALRLIPALAFLFVGHMAFTVIVGGAVKAELIQFSYIFLYVANWHEAFAPASYTKMVFSSTWTLSVEEQYYLIFFPTLMLLMRFVKSMRKIMWILLGAVIVVMLWRTFVALRTPVADFRSLVVRTDTRADALLMGPIAALAIYSGLKITPRLRQIGLISGGFMLWFLIKGDPYGRWVYTYGFTILDVSVAMTLVALIGGTSLAARSMRTRPMVWLGRVSYSVYLWHVPVFFAVVSYSRMFKRFGGADNFVMLIVAVAISFAIASFSYYVIEMPFLHLKKRRSRVSSGAVEAVEDPSQQEDPKATPSELGSPVAQSIEPAGP